MQTLFTIKETPWFRQRVMALRGFFTNFRFAKDLKQSWFWTNQRELIKLWWANTKPVFYDYTRCDYLDRPRTFEEFVDLSNARLVRLGPSIYVFRARIGKRVILTPFANDWQW